MNLNFCMQCGRQLIQKEIGDEGMQKYCAVCNKFYFDNPASCILAAIINEHKQVLMLKQNYISSEKYVLCSGYVKKGDTLEETLIREVKEETGQNILHYQYIQSYYFAPKNLIMAGFITYVKSNRFNHSNEVDSLLWTDFKHALKIVEYKDNFSGIHLEACSKILS